MKKVFLLFALALLMSSCATTYYQVYNVESDLEESNETYVYEDEVCKLTYDLWDNNEKFSYLFENKTDRDVYVFLPNCFMLKNGFAFDCYTDRESIYKAAITGTTPDLLKQSIMVQYSDKQLPVITIPAGSKKVIQTNQELLSEVIYVCDNKIDFPRNETNEVVYSKSSSPLVFVNRVAYSFEKNATEYNYINNEFWISGYFNNSSTKTLVDDSYRDCHTGLMVYKSINKYTSGLRFFNNYSRK